MGVTLALWVWAMWLGNSAHPVPGPSAWQAAPSPPARSDEPPLFERAFVDPQGAVAQVHAATICELPSGRLCVVWYGGTHELADDVAIYFATKMGTGEEPWTPPRAIVTRESAMTELGRYVSKVGNSVIFADAHGRLWLVYVSIALGRWSGSSLNVKISADEGRTWTPSRRLTLSPFLNLSELVRCKPFSVTEEAIAIPVYQEFLGRFPEVLWISGVGDPARLSWSKQRIWSGNSFIQPSVAWSEGTLLRTFLRDCTKIHTVAASDSPDGALSWQKPRRVSLPNPGSGLDALRLEDGQLLLVFNDSSTGRENLRVASTRDGGQTWRRLVTLDEESGEEFSYPCMIHDRAGRIHVVYTWKRKHIQHAVFNLAWLARQAASGSRQ